MDNSTISTYQKRWEIETMFGALKSKGFNFEDLLHDTNPYPLKNSFLRGYGLVSWSKLNYDTLYLS